MKYITGLLLMILSVLMIVFAFMFWNEDEEAIVMLASLYVALFISVLVGLIGIAIFTSKHTTVHVIDEEDDGNES